MMNLHLFVGSCQSVLLILVCIVFVLLGGYYYRFQDTRFASPNYWGKSLDSTPSPYLEDHDTNDDDWDFDDELVSSNIDICTVWLQGLNAILQLWAPASVVEHEKANRLFSLLLQSLNDIA